MAEPAPQWGIEKYPTIPRFAAYINRHEKTVYKMIRAGRLPAFQLGGTWRVHMPEFEKMATAEVRTNMGKPKRKQTTKPKRARAKT